MNTDQSYLPSACTFPRRICLQQEGSLAQLSSNLNIGSCALVLAGIELLFFLIAGTVLRSRFRVRIMLITH